MALQGATKSFGRRFHKLLSKISKVADTSLVRESELDYIKILPPPFSLTTF